MSNRHTDPPRRPSPPRARPGPALVVVVTHRDEAAIAELVRIAAGGAS